MAGTKQSFSTGQKTTYIDNSGNKQAGYTAPAATTAYADAAGAALIAQRAAAASAPKTVITTPAATAAATPATSSANAATYNNYIAKYTAAKAAKQAAQTPAAAPATTYTDVLVNQQRAKQTPAASSGGTIQAQKTTYPLAANETPQATTLPRTTTEAPQVAKLVQHKASNFDNTLAKSQQAEAASTPNGAVQTTYTDAQGNTRTGWIINGTTYQDAFGVNPVGVGSIVNTSAGQYIKTANGSMRYEDYLAQQAATQPATGAKDVFVNPTTPATSAAPATAAPYETTYTDARGNKYTGYIINGKTYVDAAGTQEVPVGSYVTDASGRVWRKGYGNASEMVYSPLEEDHYDYMTGVGNTKSLEFTTPDGYHGYLVANPDKGIYYVEDSQHNQIGYIDSAGVYHSAYYDSDYDKAMAAAAKQTATGNGYQFNGSGVVKIANGQDQNLERTYLINQYADALDRGEDGADILRQLGYTGPVTEGVKRTGTQGTQGTQGTTTQGTQTLTTKGLTGTQGTGAQLSLQGVTAGGAQEYSSALQDLQAQLEQVDFALEQAKALNDELHTAQLEQVRARIQEQIATLNEQYQSLNRQLYVDYMKSRRDLPQLLAAQGYTGGLRESSMLGLETAYGENLAQNERERMSGIRSIEAGGLDNELTLAIENAKAQQDAEDRAYERAAKIRAAIIEQKNYEDKQEREARQQEQQLAQQQINAYLSAGGDPAGIPADLLAISGLSSSYVGAIADNVARQRQQEDQALAQQQISSYLKAGGTSSGIPEDLLAASGYSTEYIKALSGENQPKLTAAQVNSAIKDGNLTPQVLADYEYYYGQPYQVATPAAAATGASGGGGYDNAGLSMEQVKQIQRQAGLTGSAVDGKWGSQTTAAVGMTAAQYTGNGGGTYTYQDALKDMAAYAAAGGTANMTAGDMIQTELAQKVKQGVLTDPQAQAIMDALGV